VYLTLDTSVLETFLVAQSEVLESLQRHALQIVYEDSDYDLTLLVGSRRY